MCITNGHDAGARLHLDTNLLRRTDVLRTASGPSAGGRLHNRLLATQGALGVLATLLVRTSCTMVWPVTSKFLRSTSQATGAALRALARQTPGLERTVNCPVGSRFSRSVPLKSTGSCGMSAMLPRSFATCSFAISMPSMWIEPEASSDRRKSAFRMLDLPAPVRPTTPTCMQ